jgi:hypothetical protein
MSLRPTTRIRTSPVGRYNILNNVGKTVNLFREYAAMPGTHIRWVVGHGLQLAEYKSVPANTFVVFLGAPGQYARTSLLPHTSKAYKSIKYLRDVFAGRIQNISPERLGYWKRHVYGPNDMYPDLKIDMWDYTTEVIPLSNGPVTIRHDLPRSDYDRVCGVKDMNTGVKILYKKTRTIDQIITSRGAGIYLIMACRASSERITRGAAMRNFLLSSPSQSFVPRVRNNRVNVNVQTHENIQARVATHKRSRSTSRPSPRRPSPVRTNYHGNVVMRN